MKCVHLSAIIFIISLIFSKCNAQTNQQPEDQKNQVKKVGGNFENSAFTYYGIPKQISSTDTSIGYLEGGQKLLLTGTVYQLDGKTPVPDVLIYYYHTNTKGRYEHRKNEPRSMEPNENGQTHGYLRGWVKTDANGNYSIYTFRPGAYPTHDEPEHIHLTVKEPNDLNEYYIDDIVFDDDKLLTTQVRQKFKNRGGSGVVRVLLQDALQIAEKDIILGLNIPNYPSVHHDKNQSGLHIGEDQPSFIPYHAYGPDKGKRTCPVCKYGRYHGIIMFVGNQPNWNDIKSWLVYLEQESMKRAQYLKVYFVYGNSVAYEKAIREKELERLGAELNIKNTALTFVPSYAEDETEASLNHINPNVENTFILYKYRRIVDKYINLKPTTENFEKISTALDKTKGAYFYLPVPEHH